MMTIAGLPYEYSLVARFNTDGMLDNTFAGDGIFTLPAGPSDISNRANAVAIQSDGGIVFGGELSPNMARTGFVRRLMPNGTIDMSFGTNGQYVPWPTTPPVPPGPRRFFPPAVGREWS